MKQHRIIRFSGLFLLLGVLFGLAACNDWTEMEAVDNNVKKPWEQDPALWAEYTAALRDYKKSEHFIVYARLHNSPEPAASEKDFMRCLPDSLDIVALTNADNFWRVTMPRIWPSCARKARKCSGRWTMPDVPPNSPTPRNWAHGSTGSCRPSPPTAWTAIRSPGFPTPAIRQRCRPQR